MLKFSCLFGKLDVYTLYLHIQMQQVLEILKLAHRGGIEPSLDLLYHKEQQIPGSINYDINRYYAQHPWVADDAGMLVYHYDEKKPQDNFLELRYCT
ncbi:MAG: hypothetical protein ACOVNY_12660, partial [Chitinophagaceae bacterium]